MQISPEVMCVQMRTASYEIYQIRKIYILIARRRFGMFEQALIIAWRIGIRKGVK
jgi:hypothetical protein